MKSTLPSPSVKRQGLILLFLGVTGLIGLGMAQYYLNVFKLDEPLLGERIYNQGLSSFGEPLRGQTEGDLDFTDAHFNCAQCHRRSGYGASEGGNYVLPITGPSLFNPRRFDRADLFKKLFTESQSKLFAARMRSSYERPAYSAETLARAIREGIDPTGRQLSPLMPRYQLNERDMAGLINYLNSLSARNDPGVDERSIYFATVVSKGSRSDDKDAMLSTIVKFVEWLNIETKGNQDHPNFSPSYRSDFAKAFRIWNHEVWELSDNPIEWPSELADHYKNQPVFALVGGMVDGDWTPIHDFCEKNKVPCLLPLTSLPVVDQPSHFSIYFSEGILLEAKTIAHYLRKQKKPDSNASIVQIYSEDAEGIEPSKALTQALSLNKTQAVDNLSVRDISDFRTKWSAYLKSHQSPGTVVVWPGKLENSLVSEIIAISQDIERIFLPSDLLNSDLNNLSKGMESKLNFSYPYELPDTYHPHAFRVRAWMNTRKLDIEKPNIQFNTYYALNLLQTSLEHLVDHFSREYLLENIENEAENAINPGIFPRLSLGPEQRYASKGAYIVQIDTSGKQLIKPISPWITP